MAAACNVANASSDTVMVKVQNEKCYMIEGACNLGLRGGAEGISVGTTIRVVGECNWERVTKGFTDIPPKSDMNILFMYDTFTEAAPGGPTAYVSVIMRSTRQVIALGLPVARGYNVIVKADGTLIEAEYGKIWVDKNGRQHCPSLRDPSFIQ